MNHEASQSARWEQALALCDYQVPLPLSLSGGSFPVSGSFLTHRWILCRSAPDWVKKEGKRDLFVNCKVLFNCKAWGITLICLPFTNLKIRRQVCTVPCPCTSMSFSFNACVRLLLSSPCPLVPAMPARKIIIRKGVLSWSSGSHVHQSTLPLLNHK